MVQDMTKGSVLRQIVIFAIPLFIGNIFQQAYNLVDAVVVGRFVGKNALAAVGTSFPALFLLIALVMGLTMGASVVVSQLFGAGEIKKMRRAVSTTLIFLSICALSLTVIGLLVSRKLLMLLQTPPEILEEATVYLHITFAGLLFMFLYNIVASFMRALGDSRTPLYFLIISSLLNIGLDLLFVLRYNMGVAGVAWATVVAQAVSVVLSIVYIYWRVDLLKLYPRDIVFDWKIFVEAVRLGIPASIQQTVLSLGMVAVQGLVNSFGSVTIAAYTAACRIDSIAMMPIMNLGLAVSTFTAQNIGASELDRVRRGYRQTLAMVAASCVITTTIVLLYGPKLIQLFVDAREVEVIAQGNDYITVVSFFYIFMGLLFVTNGVLRGSGDMAVSMVSTIISLTARVIFAYLLSAKPEIGYRGLWWSIPIGWGFGFVVSYIRYRSGRWTEKGVVETISGRPAEAETLP
ncbi:MAG: MATE family efflux transporter [Firmicutes bacterium]|nr:MATE family efflux transporter [Bacillota bacterium]